ncbi:MAG: DEAD/DEAH box helicase [Spirochaetaceae bacterium]|nr:DEAD/DEAH box helicase [Spirochaetaceae bacterium]
MAALESKGFTAPSSIQNIAIPRLMADSGHLIVKARTGTGKTAAFGIPLVEKITASAKEPRALILTPTRELALQVSREIRSLSGAALPRIAAVYGGASIRTQIQELRRGTEIVCGTPGRVMDLMERKLLDLSCIEWFILDEADEMLDMGFLEDVEHIMKAVNPERRVALFSATMPQAILNIVRNHIGEVDFIEDQTGEDEKPPVDQAYIILREEDKFEALKRIAGCAEEFYSLVFRATKSGADSLAKRLADAGYDAEAIHGDLSQEERERALGRFRAGKEHSRSRSVMLVATDVAARGIDIPALTHVINWDLPNDRESYVHRIGRTGRAGLRGIAVSFVLPQERGRMSHLSRSMERSIGSGIGRMKLPAVPEVMEALRKRILASLVTDNAETQAAPDSETALLARDLVSALGAEKAAERLIAKAYGGLLESGRYRAVAEFEEMPKPHLPHQKLRGREETGRGTARVYVGLGRRHGASPRDVASLLMKAGGVPGRLVDAIEMKDYCSFATMPLDAAKRAYGFSHRSGTLIKPAGGRKHV